MGRVSVTTYDAQGRVRAVDRSGLSDLAFVYDSAGRVTSKTMGSGPSARTARFSYYTGTSDTAREGQLASIEWPELEQASFLVPDVWGRVASSTRADGRSIQQSFDPKGNVLSIQPPDRPTHTMTYTAPGDPDLYTAPPSMPGSTAPVHDRDYSLDRDLEIETLADGSTIDSVYNPAGQLTQFAMTGATVTFGYNATSGLVQTVARVDSDGTHTSTLTRDGSLITREAWSGTTGLTVGAVERVFDANLWTTTHRVVTPVGSFSVANAYDDDGLITAAGPATITREAASGLPSAITVGQIQTIYGWNEHGELTTQTASFAGTPFFTETVTALDVLGRVSASETGGAAARAYTYDRADRLQSVLEQGIEVARYAYDANGNRLGRTTAVGTVHGSYDDQDRLTRYCPQDGAGAPQPIAGLPCFAYSYKPTGELASKTNIGSGAVTEYLYDGGGALTRVNLPGGDIVTYEIDSFGRRVGKRLNGVKSWGLLYRDAHRPIAELAPNGALRAVFIYGATGHTPDLVVKGNATYRIISDRVGSVRRVVDAATGIVSQALDYDEFGNVLADSNPGFQPFGFAGGLYDADTGLVRFGARDYDAVTGRWTAKDLIGFAGGDTNLYAYCFNDPVNLIDPSGLFVPVLAGAVVGGALVGGAVGAITGGLTSWVQGGDVLNGALGGARTGAITGGLAGITSAFTTGAVAVAVGLRLGTAAQAALGFGNAAFQSNLPTGAAILRTTVLKDFLEPDKASGQGQPLCGP